MFYVVRAGNSEFVELFVRDVDDNGIVCFTENIDEAQKFDDKKYVLMYAKILNDSFNERTQTNSNIYWVEKVKSNESKNKRTM